MSCYEDITVVLLLIGVMLRRYVTMVSYISYNINVRPCEKALRYIDTLRWLIAILLCVLARKHTLHRYFTSYIDILRWLITILMCVFALEHTLHRYFTGYIDILLFCRFDLVTRTSVDPPRKSKKKKIKGGKSQQDGWQLFVWLFGIGMLVLHRNIVSPVGY